MKITLEQRDDGIELSLSELAGREDKLLRAFEACRDGRCDCPMRRHQQLAGMDVAHGCGTITLRFYARDGEQFDIEAVGRCLGRTVGEKAPGD